jgi:hypothetical protein
VTKRRDVLSDYRQFYWEAEKGPVASGLAVLNDLDDTYSHAIGDYADIRTMVTKGGKTGSTDFQESRFKREDFSIEFWL